mmetsp:Transcript_33641/g.101572  ORF Transcript_33641/g.101572 Transcript_33641/m.101572 type:complete len:282 (-) Transcript_33641:211-1056(-)
MRPLRPVISATAPTPPSSEINVSSGLPGSPRSATALSNRRRTSRIKPKPSSSSSSSSAFLTLSSSSIASSSSARFSTSVNENATLDASTPPPLKSELVRFSVRNSTKRSTSSFGNDGSANGASTEPPYALAPMMLPSCASALRPHFVSKLNAVSPRPLAPTVPRRSPCVSAPSDSSLRATADAKRRSPPTDEMRNLYSGADDWFDRCDRPNCWIALSADHGSSSVMCTRRRWFPTTRLACNEIPADAASEMMATNFRPSLNAFFSCMFCISSVTPLEFRSS